MDASTIEIVMKGMTFLGVALAAALVASRHASTRALVRDAALGALGVLLMFGNARLGAGAIGLAVDATYLGVCAVALTRHARAMRHKAPAPTGSSAR